MFLHWLSQVVVTRSKIITISEYQLSEQIQTTSIDEVNHDKTGGLSRDFGWSS